MRIVTNQHQQDSQTLQVHVAIEYVILQLSYGFYALAAPPSVGDIQCRGSKMHSTSPGCAVTWSFRFRHMVTGL